MDEIHAPRQATLRTSREIHDDPEQQSQIIRYRSRNQPRFHQVTVLEYTGLLSVPRLLAIFVPEFSRPNYSLLPFSVRKTPRKALNPTLQNTGVRHRNAPRNGPDQTTQTPETGNQRAEATEGNLEDPEFDPQIFRHESRRKELLEILEPALGSDNSDSSFILLCWGKESLCHIVPVKIQDSADDVAIWQEIRRVWYAHKGGWRTRLGLFGVRKVDIVNVRPVHSASKFSANGANRYHKVSIAGRAKSKGGFVGAYTTEDIAAEKRRLEEIIANYQPPKDDEDEFISWCQYDPRSGRTHCTVNCRSNYDGFEACPEVEFDRTQRKLLRLNKMRPFLTLAFSDPGVAAVNNLLDTTGVINRHWNILSMFQDWHCPDLGELPFKALMIDGGSEPGSQQVSLLLGVAVCIIMVIGAKLIFGDWGTAWNVGCFLVALATLSWMWVTHTGD